MWFAFGYATGKRLVQAVNLFFVVSLLVDRMSAVFKAFGVLLFLIFTHFTI